MAIADPDDRGNSQLVKRSSRRQSAQFLLPDLLMYTCRLPLRLMKQALSRKLILFATGAAIIVASVLFGIAKVRSVMNGSKANATRLDRMPREMLWAWERPTDLRFINPKETGVAFLAQSIRLRSGEVEIRPRLQPLNLPEGASVMAVARVETDKPELSSQQREKLAAAIADMARLPNVSDIQIDFDATKSERAFYRDLIVDVRRRLPDDVSLSITAL